MKCEMINNNNEKIKTINIGFCGFACNGKTTTINTLSPFVREICKLKVIKISEFIREYEQIMINILNKEFDITSVKVQLSLIPPIIYLNEYIFNIRKKITEFELSSNNEYKGICFFHDRTVFDYLIFSHIRGYISFEDILKVIGNFYNSIDYDFIIVIDKVKSKETIENVCFKDDIRKRTIADFFEMQEKYYKTLYKIFGELCMVENKHFYIFDNPIEKPHKQLEIVSKIIDLISKEKRY